MHLSSIGEMIRDAWRNLPRLDPQIQLDEFVVMPNHIHGIIVLDDPVSFRADVHSRAGTRPAPTVRYSLPDIVRILKSLSTVEYIKRMGKNGWPQLSGRLWQRGYYEHIIRSDEDLRRIREYIRANPAHWDFDPENIN